MLRKLQSSIGFDVLERYRRLRDFYRQADLTDEAEWIDIRLRFITDGNTAPRFSLMDDGPFERRHGALQAKDRWRWGIPAGPFRSFLDFLFREVIMPPYLSFRRCENEGRPV